MSKLACGLLSDKYSAPEILPPIPGDEAKGEEKEEGKEDSRTACISPDMFKALIGAGHPEFSSARQQDAEEFFRHFLDQLARTERTAVGDIADGKRGVGAKVVKIHHNALLTTVFTMHY
jgi:ubiquitin carboxyl-terminal hydrolase 5/13